MTGEEREKAIDLLDNLVGMIEDNQDNDYDFALKKGIEALKQEDVIDKIKAEIEQLPSQLTVDGRRMVRSRNVFRIIDKYKAECEEQE